MLGGHFAALGEAAAGEDVAMRRSHVALVRTVFSYAVYEGFYREEIIAAPIYYHSSLEVVSIHQYVLGRPSTSALV